MEEKIGKLGELIGSIDLDLAQKYLLGYKRSGRPRALYDIYRDHCGCGPKRKKKKSDRLSLYLGSKRKKNKKNKKWKWGE